MELSDAPGTQGFLMPAEWELHARTWMAWPCRVEAWGDGARMGRAKAAYARVAQAIAVHEAVTMVTRKDDASEAEAACGPAVQILPASIDDSWIRDTGPLFVAKGAGRAREIAGTDWQFNAWGRKYKGFSRDDALPEQLLSHLAIPRSAARMVLEGGAVNSDGDGTLLTTEECVLNPNRNAKFTRAKAEEMFARYLGIRKVIWLPFGFDDDETDGHVDNVAAFAGVGRVLLHTAAESGDSMVARSQANANALKGAVDAKGRKIEIVRVPAPKREIGWNGRKLPASYLNFYVSNGGIYIPQFNDPLDRTALKIIGDCFPMRKIVPLPANDIIVGGGGIHCITQQQPAGVPARI